MAAFNVITGFGHSKTKGNKEKTNKKLEKIDFHYRLGSLKSNLNKELFITTVKRSFGLAMMKILIDSCLSPYT